MNKTTAQKKKKSAPLRVPDALATSAQGVDQVAAKDSPQGKVGDNTAPLATGPLGLGECELDANVIEARRILREGAPDAARAVLDIGRNTQRNDATRLAANVKTLELAGVVPPRPVAPAVMVQVNNGDTRGRVEGRFDPTPPPTL